MVAGITNLLVLPIIALGANRGTAVFREMSEQLLRDSLERIEKKYLQQNPDASKKNAFEFAKDQLSETKENSGYMMITMEKLLMLIINPELDLI